MKTLFVRPDLPGGLNIVPQSAPPLGLMYMASYLLRARSTDEVRIIDCTVDRFGPADVGRTARSFGPDVVGISAMSIHAPVLHEIAGHVKRELPDATVVAGGPYAAATPERVLADPNVDIAVPGEGEATFLELVEALEKRRPLDEVPGLILRDGVGDLVQTAMREPIVDLDSLPLPAWNLAGIDKFFPYRVLTQNNIRAHPKYTTIFTSRACPYRCIYCHNIFGKRFRARSTSNVLEEISILYNRYGIREFHIIDDCFNLNIDRAQEIMQGIVDMGWDIKIAFPNGIRVDRLPEDLLQLMHRAGVYKMNFGIESGAKRIQALMQKNLDLGLTKNAIDRADRRGFITHGFFMIGFPTETLAEMIETVEFACSSRLMMAGFFFVNPYPNTALYEMAISNGRCPPDVVGDEGCFSDVGVNLTAASDDELGRMLHRAYRRFYLDPARMVRLLRRLPRKLDFWEQFLAHWRVKFV